MKPLNEDLPSNRTVVKRYCPFLSPVSPSLPQPSHLSFSLLPPHPSHPLRSPPFAQSSLAILPFRQQITQISNAIASTAFPKAVYTPHSQSILPIMTTQRTENLVFRASAQSILTRTTAHPYKSVDPRQNALFFLYHSPQPTQPDQSRCPSFLPSPASVKPSFPTLALPSLHILLRRLTQPFQPLLGLAKIKSACTSLKIRYRPPVWRLLT